MAVMCPRQGKSSGCVLQYRQVFSMRYFAVRNRARHREPFSQGLLRLFGNCGGICEAFAPCRGVRTRVQGSLAALGLFPRAWADEWGDRIAAMSRDGRWRERAGSGAGGRTPGGYGLESRLCRLVAGLRGGSRNRGPRHGGVRALTGGGVGVIYRCVGSVPAVRGMFRFAGVECEPLRNAKDATNDDKLRVHEWIEWWITPGWGRIRRLRAR